MEEVGLSLGSVSLWVGAIVGAVLGLVLQQLWNGQLSNRVAAWRARARFARDSRRGRTPAVGQSIPTAGTVLPKYFRQQDDAVDLAIYELSLRPNVPVMDLLYMEYLRGRIDDGTIGHVVIVPWSGWRDDQNHDAEKRVTSNIYRVFGSLSTKVTVVTAEMLQEQAGSVFENHFFEQVGNLGNSGFLRNASNVMGYRFRSCHDINQGHPESHQARSIVEHTVRGWLIYKFIEREYINTTSPPKRIGSLMWERELTKLLLLSNIVENYEIDCSIMLGDSVTYLKRLRRQPLPTFEKQAITVFGTLHDQYALIARKSQSELRRTNEVLSEILRGRRGLRDLPGWAGNAEALRENSGLKGEGLALAQSLRRLHAIYGRLAHEGEISN